MFSRPRTTVEANDNGPLMLFTAATVASNSQYFFLFSCPKSSNTFGEERVEAQQTRYIVLHHIARLKIIDVSGYTQVVKRRNCD